VKAAGVRRIVPRAEAHVGDAGGRVRRTTTRRRRTAGA
jgi:hypothetical protein